MNHFPSLNPAQETEKIKAFIKATFDHTGKKTAVIALSGGLDSSTTFALTIQALSSKHLHAYYLPAKHSHPKHVDHIKQLIKVHHLPAQNFHPIPITAIIQKTWRIIKHNEAHPKQVVNDPLTARLRLANLTARIRMQLIFDAAKKLNALVIGTENLSEHLLGYYTRFGDEASDIEPIRHLYKTQVIKLSRYLKIPLEIITKPPTADLWPNQTDASELGFTYSQADPILNLLNQGKSSQAIEKIGFDAKLIQAIHHQMQATKFKHQVPYHL